MFFFLHFSLSENFRKTSHYHNSGELKTEALLLFFRNLRCCFFTFLAPPFENFRKTIHILRISQRNIALKLNLNLLLTAILVIVETIFFPKFPKFPIIKALLYSKWPSKVNSILLTSTKGLRSTR